MKAYIIEYTGRYNINGTKQFQLVTESHNPNDIKVEISEEAYEIYLDALEGYITWQYILRNTVEKSMNVVFSRKEDEAKNE